MPTPSPADRPVVLLVTTNGWGMGHLSRQIAIGKALDDRLEPVLLSLSGAVHLVASQGIRAEYCPSPTRGWLTPTDWNGYLGRRIVALAEELNARALVFDGVFPYRGLFDARRKLPDVLFVWSRRGMWQAGKGRRSLRNAGWFDRIVEPGDLGQEEDHGLTVGRGDAIRVPPVSLLDVNQPLPRAQARAGLNLSADAPLLLVSLSAGTGDAAAVQADVIRAALDRPDWHIAVISNPLQSQAAPGSDDLRVQRLVDVYPLVNYLAAFDAAVVSAGYNAAHELPLAGVPSLLVANRRSFLDDQIGRARGIAGRGLALWAMDDAVDEIGRKTEELLGEQTRARLAGALANLGSDERGGAQAVAEVVAKAVIGDGGNKPLRSRGARRTDKLIWSAVAFAWQVRTVLVRLRDALYRAVLRRPIPRSAAVTTVVDEPADTPPDSPAANAKRNDLVLVTERLTREVIGGVGPVEHVLPGTSARYRQARLDIVRNVFHVGSPGT